MLGSCRLLRLELPVLPCAPRLYRFPWALVSVVGVAEMPIVVVMVAVGDSNMITRSSTREMQDSFAPWYQSLQMKRDLQIMLL